MPERGVECHSTTPVPGSSPTRWNAVKLIDRSCDLSPEGEIVLTAGWVKHRCAANWKMLPENDSDGYHLGFVHRALLKTVQSQYQSVVGDERTIKAGLHVHAGRKRPPPVGGRK